MFKIYVTLLDGEQKKKKPRNIIYYTHLGKTTGDQIRSAS